MNPKTGEDYVAQAARLLGYPDVKSIESPGEVDRVAVIAHDLLTEWGAGYDAGWRDAQNSLDRILSRVRR